MSTVTNIKGQTFKLGETAMVWYPKSAGDSYLELFFCKILDLKNGKHIKCELYDGDELNTKKLKGTFSDINVLNLIKKL